jgi:hypothetical protein
VFLQSGMCENTLHGDNQGLDQLPCLALRLPRTLAMTSRAAREAGLEQRSASKRSQELVLLSPSGKAISLWRLTERGHTAQTMRATNLRGERKKSLT